MQIFFPSIYSNYSCSTNVHQIFFFHPCAPKILFLPSAPNIFVLPMCTNYSSSTHVHQIFFFLPGAPIIFVPLRCTRLQATTAHQALELTTRPRTRWSQWWQDWSMIISVILMLFKMLAPRCWLRKFLQGHQGQHSPGPLSPMGRLFYFFIIPPHNLPRWHFDP